MILEKITEYFSHLEWGYIISFILICYFLAKDGALKSWWKESESEWLNKLRLSFLSVPKGFRVLCLGIVFSIVYMILYNAKVSEIFESFIFSVAMHGLLLKYIEKWFELNFTRQ